MLRKLQRRRCWTRSESCRTTRMTLMRSTVRWLETSTSSERLSRTNASYCICTSKYRRCGHCLVPTLAKAFRYTDCRTPRTSYKPVSRTWLIGIRPSGYELDERNRSTSTILQTLSGAMPDDRRYPIRTDLLRPAGKAVARISRIPIIRLTHYRGPRPFLNCATHPLYCVWNCRLPAQRGAVRRTLCVDPWQSNYLQTAKAPHCVLDRLLTCRLGWRHPPRLSPLLAHRGGARHMSSAGRGR